MDVDDVKAKHWLRDLDYVSIASRALLFGLVFGFSASIEFEHFTKKFTRSRLVSVGVCVCWGGGGRGVPG